MAQDQGETVAIDIGDAVLSSVTSNINALHRVPMKPESFTIFRVPAHFGNATRTSTSPGWSPSAPTAAATAPISAQWSSTTGGAAVLLRARRAKHREVRGDAAPRRVLHPRVPHQVEPRDVDSVCTAGWSLPLVRGDLLLLENQIPLFVLEKLFELVTFSMDDEEIPSLMELLVNYLASRNVERPEDEIVSSNEEAEGIRDPGRILPGKAEDFHHLLHLYYRCYVPTPQTDPTESTICGTVLKWLKPSKIFASLLSHLRIKIWGSQAPAYKKRSPNTIPSATELEEAGVTFKKKGERKKNNMHSSFLDVAFHDGVLEIPFLSVENSTLSRFTNLVAFEQCSGCKEEEAYMTSYAMFMDCLIDTPADVAILHRRGFLENKLASDEELAVFFNQLSECATIDHEKHYLAGLFRDVRKYCDSRWPKWRAKLVRDYFSNPWAILSLIAAVVVLIFTFLQTFYTIFTYYHPRN
uniref:Uncharacterized protein n=1 Tax=Ananas comosus var. bracteatus TaxID=296719 RepID=A0A6V7NY48_ANACO|nr:unnamed protein product [Ananas comosus var. bracteatus]